MARIALGSNLGLMRPGMTTMERQREMNKMGMRYPKRPRPGFIKFPFPVTKVGSPEAERELALTQRETAVKFKEKDLAIREQKITEREQAVATREAEAAAVEAPSEESSEETNEESSEETNIDGLGQGKRRQKKSGKPSKSMMKPLLIGLGLAATAGGIWYFGLRGKK